MEDTREQPTILRSRNHPTDTRHNVHLVWYDALLVTRSIEWCRWVVSATIRWVSVYDPAPTLPATTTTSSSSSSTIPHADADASDETGAPRTTEATQTKTTTTAEEKITQETRSLRNPTRTDESRVWCGDWCVTR